MYNFIKSKIILVLFFLNFLFVNLLAAEIFDDHYAVKITNSWSAFYPPSISCNYWETVHFIHFDNGLYATTSREWQHESQAKQWAKVSYSGNVNIFKKSYNDSFSFLIEGEYCTHSIKKLWLEYSPSSENYKSLPKITSITENVKPFSKKGSKKYKYQYVIELDNGLRWSTSSSNFKWKNIWKAGSRILKIGNSEYPIFINIELVSGEKKAIEMEYCIFDMELLN